MTDPRPGDAFQAGDVLNNTYRVEALLGRGGTSEVYRARSEISGRQVAVKVLKAEFSGNDDYLVLLTREEEIREVRHDAIVRYSENHRTSEGLVYLLMDYIDGPGLDRKLREGPMAAEDLLTICRRVADGLRAAHARSIVHRDLSPDNIILRDGDPAQAVVIDFGIAKDTNPGAQTIVGNEFAGKYAYAAPEQLSGKTDQRTDIYSLGALLLANFRGKKPDAGANPMEVLEKKGQPLDTEGVPEPLKSLIDRMTAPDPAARFQSMEEVLSFLDSGAPPEGAEDMEATILVAPPPKRDDPPAPAPAPRSRAGGLIAALAGLLLVALGAGAWYGGLIGGPSLPEVNPYELRVAQPENAAAAATGYVPGEEMRNDLAALMAEIGGTTDVTLAAGEITADWPETVLAILADLAPLDSWQLEMRDNSGSIIGSTSDPALQAALMERYGGAWPGGLSGEAQIALLPLFLDPAAVADLLDQYADCGPLTQVDPPQTTGYGPDSPIRVSGTLANEASRAELAAALRDFAGDRPVSLETDLLNPTLCLVENYLVDAPDSEIDILFRDGASGEEMPSGRFLVGQNPVIDVALPAGVTEGHLAVSVLDVSGNVFHLLPNIGRPESAVSALRDGEEGPLTLRVAYSLEEDRPEGAIAFAVDDSALGKSKVLVLHSDAPIFEEMRPTTESAVGYAEALARQQAAQENLIRSLDSRILTTARP